MRIKIIGIYDRGDLSKERLHLSVTSDIDLNGYAIYDTVRKSETTVRAGQSTAFWFSSKKILTGQNVVIYTKKGTPNEEKRDNGSVFHFMFRNLDHCLYQSTEFCPVVFELESWNSQPENKITQ